MFAAFWNEGIFVSTDRGVTWARSGLGITIHILWATFTIGVLPTGSAAGWIKLAMGRNGAGGTQFLVAKMGLDSGEVYTTSDGGTTWFPVSGTHQPASYNEWTNMIGVHPNNHGIIVAGGVGLERSTNGSSFAGVGGTHSDHQAIDFDPANPSRAFMATDGGVYRSLDSAASWGLFVNGLTATQFYSLGVSQTARSSSAGRRRTRRSSRPQGRRHGSTRVRAMKAASSSSTRTTAATCTSRRGATTCVGAPTAAGPGRTSARA